MPLDNPFQILTFIAAPAILTNASSIMALGTSNRFARVVDRTRTLAASLKQSKPATGTETAEHAAYLRLLERNEKRGIYLVRALGWFYFSIGSFAASALISLLGASAASLDIPYALRICLTLALVAGITGVTGLVTGCTLLVHETRLMLSNLREESSIVRNQSLL